MAYVPKDTVKPKRTQVIEDDDTIITYHYEYNRMVRTDIKYKAGYKTREEEVAEMNKGLPKTQRKYLDEDYKLVSYLTAKKKGLI